MPTDYRQNGLGLARRILFASLLVLSLVLVTLYAREGEAGRLHAIQGSVMSVTSPIGGLGKPLGVATNALGTAAGDARASQETLSALREQNEELRQLLSNTEEYRQEVERLRGLLDIKRVSGAEGPVANVIGRSANAWDQSITIDLGKEDGMEAGMTVLGATGVIGQIVRVESHMSVVRLLTDPNSGAAVKIQSTRANAIVRGSLTGLLYLEDIEGDQIPEVGDVIITSGLGGSYASGLIVGAVVAVNKTPGNATGSIIVNPNDNGSDVEVVIVVTGDQNIKQGSVNYGLASTGPSSASPES